MGCFVVPLIKCKKKKKLGNVVSSEEQERKMVVGENKVLPRYSFMDLQ